jgi:predicted membrane-bound mannosyltransferase
MKRWIPIGLLVVLAVGVRLYHLGHENFWIDEVEQVQVASQPIEEILRNYDPGADPRLYQQAPLSLIITHLFLLPSASPEWAARLPSVIFGVGSVLALYLVACELSAAPVPLLAALFLTVSPLHVWYSQEARWYAQWVFLATLAYWAFLRAWRLGRMRHWVSYATLTLLNVYTFILSFVVVGCQTLSARRLRQAAASPCKNEIADRTLPKASIVSSDFGNYSSNHRRAESSVKLQYQVCPYSTWTCWVPRRVPGVTSAVVKPSADALRRAARRVRGSRARLRWSGWVS